MALGHWKYAARGPHYVALGPHDATLGPRSPLYGPLAASWGPLVTYCLALGRHIFQCPSARGVILLQYFMTYLNLALARRHNLTYYTPGTKAALIYTKMVFLFSLCDRGLTPTS